MKYKLKFGPWFYRYCQRRSDGSITTAWSCLDSPSVRTWKTRKAAEAALEKIRTMDGVHSKAPDKLMIVEVKE